MSVFGSHIVQAKVRDAGVNRDARNGAKLRLTARVIEVHVASFGDMPEPPRVKMARVGPGRHSTQSERIRAKMIDIDKRLARYALALQDGHVILTGTQRRVLLNLGQRYVERLSAMN